MEHIINGRSKALLFGGAALALSLWGYRTYVSLTTPAPKQKTPLEQVPTKQSSQSSQSQPESIPKNPLQDFFDKQLLTIEKICKLFELKPAELLKIRECWLEEMKLGLETTGRSSMQMIPTFVPILASGQEQGSFMALDIGGTNYRIAEITVKGNGQVQVGRKDHVQLPLNLLSGTSDELFDFFADSVKNFLQHNPDSSFSEIGFTFSFPVQQTGIAAGKLIKWTKEFNTSGVEGKDVVDLLHAAFRRKGIDSKLHVEALVNDTVGTLVASSYLHPEKPTLVSLIIGTGTNLAYFESMDRVKKWKNPVPESGKMVINMESGNFDSVKKTALPRTDIDRTLDTESNNPGNQFFEKMISGRYLGEILRICLNILTKNKYILPSPDRASLFDAKYSIDTQVMSQLQSDETEELTIIESWLVGCGVDYSTVLDRIIIKRLCVAISTRAAYLTAMAITGVLTHLELKSDAAVIVAVDGSVFEKYTNFANVLRATIRELGFTNVDLRLTTDGSSTGAAITAAVISTLSPEQKSVLREEPVLPQPLSSTPEPTTLAPSQDTSHTTSSQPPLPFGPVPVPALTEPVHTEPVHVEPVHTGPVHTEPVHAEPIHAEPVHVAPVHAELVHTEPVHAEPVHAEPVHAEPVHAEPVHAEPVHVEPVHTEPVHTEPVHTEPVHTEPVHTEPVHAELIHIEPVHAESTHTEPVHAEPVHTEPTHTEPVHSEPAHTESAQTEPIHTEPVHSEPAHDHAETQ